MNTNRMRGLLLSSIALTLSLSTAQLASAQDISVGIRGGLNASYTLFEVEERADREVRPGLLLGGVFSFTMRPWIALQTEILYTQKGWGAAEGEGSVRRSYIEIPILLRLQHPGRLQPHVLLGPSLGLEAGCSFDEIAGTGRVDCDHPLITLDRSKLDGGFMVGAGIGGNMGPGALSFDALLSVGLRDVILEPLPWGAQTNLALSLSLAYSVGLRGVRGGDR